MIVQLSRVEAAEVSVEELTLETSEVSTEADTPSDTPADDEKVPPAPKAEYSYKANPLEWLLADKWLSEAKSSAGFELIDQKLKSAIAQKNQRNWGEALVRGAQAIAAIEGRSAALDWLEEQQTPEHDLEKVFIQVYALSLLVEELSVNSDAILRRGGSPLTTVQSWRWEDFDREIDQRAQKVWEQRNDWGHLLAREMSFYQEGSYPPGIHQSLLEAFYALWFESTIWRMENNPKGPYTGAKPALEEMLASEPMTGSLSVWLKLRKRQTELVESLRQAGFRAAALEAEMEWVHFLRKNYSGAESSQKLASYLVNRSGEYNSHPWWASAQALTAELFLSSGGEEALFQARGVAGAAARAYPNSSGGLKSQLILDELEKPKLEVELDGHKKNIIIRSRNTKTMQLSAYPVGLKDFASPKELLSALSGELAPEKWVKSVSSKTPILSTHSVAEADSTAEATTLLPLPEALNSGSYLLQLAPLEEGAPILEQATYLVLHQTVITPVLTQKEDGDLVVVAFAKGKGAVKEFELYSARSSSVGTSLISGGFTQLQVSGGSAEVICEESSQKQILILQAAAGFEVFEAHCPNAPRAHFAGVSLRKNRTSFFAGQSLSWQTLIPEGLSDSLQGEVQLIDPNGAIKKTWPLAESGTHLFATNDLIGFWGLSLVLRMGNGFEQKSFEKIELRPRLEKHQVLVHGVKLVGDEDRAIRGFVLDAEGNPSAKRIHWRLGASASQKQSFFQYTTHDQGSIELGNDGAFNIPLKLDEKNFLDLGYLDLYLEDDSSKLVRLDPASLVSDLPLWQTDLPQWIQDAGSDQKIRIAVTEGYFSKPSAWKIHRLRADASILEINSQFNRLAQRDRLGEEVEEGEVESDAEGVFFNLPSLDEGLYALGLSDELGQVSLKTFAVAKDRLTTTLPLLIARGHAKDTKAENFFLHLAPETNTAYLDIYDQRGLLQRSAITNSKRLELELPANAQELTLRLWTVSGGRVIGVDLPMVDKSKGSVSSEQLETRSDFNIEARPLHFSELSKNRSLRPGSFSRVTPYGVRRDHFVQVVTPEVRGGLVLKKVLAPFVYNEGYAPMAVPLPNQGLKLFSPTESGMRLAISSPKDSEISGEVQVRESASDAVVYRSPLSLESLSWSLYLLGPEHVPAQSEPMKIGFSSAEVEKFVPVSSKPSQEE